MSTASSIAQFMALLSGGVNPALLRQNGASSTETSANTNINFQNLVVTSSGLSTDLRTDSENMPANILPGLPVAKAADFKDNSDPIFTEQQIALFKISSLPDGPLKQSALEKVKALTEITHPSASIMQFIQQQVSIDGENAIVLNLSEKGIPQDVIDDLQNLFGTNDLITILRDPKLNTQLENALSDTNTETIDTPQLAGVINAILNQNKGDINNTITFKVDKGATIDVIIDTLVKDGFIESAEGNVVLLPLDIQEAKLPVNLTFVQQQLAVDNPPVQAVTQLASSANPFLKSQTGNLTATSPNLDKDLPTQPIINNTGNISETIADRLASQTSVNQGQNAPTLTTDFSSLMLNAGGDALINSDGDFILPFEAGFKTASQAANPVTMQQSATQSHPTTQMVAMSLQKMAGKAFGGEESQSYRLKLDPPEMGRIDIEMDIIDNTGKLKAVISAEKPESLGLLQRDMHVLLKAMQDAGFEGMTQQDLTFNLSQNNDNFAGNGEGKSNNGSNHNDESLNQEGEKIIAIEGEMTLIVDPITGQRHVNMIV